MPITLVFLSVVAIWSTTPLAIVWSTLGSSHSFGVAARMVLGLSICLLLLLIKKQKLTLTPLSLWNYWYAGLGVFITMRNSCLASSEQCNESTRRLLQKFIKSPLSTPLNSTSSPFTNILPRSAVA
jgi:drug/metabolite transporter (DMT)-like permease